MGVVRGLDGGGGLGGRRRDEGCLSGGAKWKESGGRFRCGKMS